MKFLSVTGHKDDMDRVIDQYLSKHEMQYENALSELKTVSNLRPFMATNPYKDVYQQACLLTDSFPKETIDNAREITLDEAVAIVTRCQKQFEELASKKEALQKSLEEAESSLGKISHFSELDYDISSILHFKFIKFRFGRISREYYDKFYNYVYDSVDTVLYRCDEDQEYVWCVYFVPGSISDKVDAIYASMHFERTFIPDEYEGTAKQASDLLTGKISDLKAQVAKADQALNVASENARDDLSAAVKRLAIFTKNFDIRKLAACTNHDEAHTHYILCGWMPEKEAESLQREMADDVMAFCIVEDNHDNITSRPPTKLKNPKIFRPFEMYVKMYGLPNYNEIDPTIIVGLTYAFIFGIMFADVGQGLCLLIGGALLYHYKKMDLAAIMSTCAVFSVIFGFLFGSFFGFENVIPALWLHPKEAMTTLPFIGSMNTVFVAAVAFGMFMILTGMVLHMINAARNHKLGELLFSQNSLAGFIFYGALAVTLVLLFSGHKAPAVGVMVVMFGIPLLAIFLKEPLERMVEKKGNAFPETGKGMFFVQAFFELFDVLLSYFSNTISFVRVGAYAVSHAAMMEVVLMLGGATGGGSISWPVIVLGNVFVACLEALLVAIQVLRLEYYEMFSRFYEGDGKPFVPFLKKGEK